MKTILRKLSNLFKQKSDLEQFVSSKYPQSTADVEHWTRYFYDNRSRFLWINGYQWLMTTGIGWTEKFHRIQIKSNHTTREASVSLNNCMMKARLSPNLISFVTVLRGNWILKVSVFKNKQIMVVSRHCFDMDRTNVNFFMDQNLAADFIEQLVIEE